MKMQKTVLVTGANGMIGRKVVERLIDAGYLVIGIDRKENNHYKNGYTHMTADIADSDAIMQIFLHNSIDRVIHLGSVFSG